MAKKRKNYKDPEWLERLYWGQGLRLERMADLAGCAISTIAKWMEEYNIPRRDPGHDSLPVLVQCEWCGKEFSKPRSHLRHKHIFCSRKCHNRWKKKQRLRYCEWCNESFYYKKKTQRFCSQKCARAASRRLVVKHCEVCGTQFTVGPARAPTAKYCSNKCKNIGSARHPNRHKRGPDSALWKGYKKTSSDKVRLRKWRDEVLYRDDYTCQCCGNTDVMLHAHHIVHYADCPDWRFDVENGVTLCYRCHALEHTDDPGLFKMIIMSGERDHG